MKNENGLQQCPDAVDVMSNIRNGKPIWLSVTNPEARLSDKLCDVMLHDLSTCISNEEDPRTDCSIDIYVKGLISPSELSQNDDGSWSCTSEKEIYRLNSIYVSTYEGKNGKYHRHRFWLSSKTMYKDNTITDIVHRLREEDRRKYYPGYLYILIPGGDPTGKLVKDFTLYSMHSIPDMGVEVVRVQQKDIPDVYKTPNGNYECRNEHATFGGDGIPFRKAKTKSPWKRPDNPPTHELCREFNSDFIAWDGKKIYTAHYDEYDKIFRKPKNIGEIVRYVPDGDIKAWTCFPTPPDENWGKTE